MEKAKLESKMLERTRKMLKERPHSINMKQIAAETGLNINWLYSLDSEASDSYGVEKIEKLFLHLGGSFAELEDSNEKN